MVETDGPPWGVAYDGRFGEILVTVQLPDVVDVVSELTDRGGRDDPDAELPLGARLRRGSGGDLRLHLAP